MKQFIGILLFTCANAIAFAQVNFVKNPSFEDTVKCIDDINQIGRAKYWTCAVDTIGEPYYAPEYYNATCGPLGLYISIPQNIRFYQNPHTGNAIVAAGLYYDKTMPVPAGATFKWRDYFQGRLYRSLVAGKTYCLSFWLNLADYSSYAHDKIGAYVDNGGINLRDTPGIEILDVIPQVYTTTIQKDTQNWKKIEGVFTATGNETHITLGIFFKQEDVLAVKNPDGFAEQFSYYLFDDVAVIPIDLKADAGKDTHAEPGKSVQIGRVGDTTAMGLDCKWYHKGALIDSGAIISVNGSGIVGTADTYVVVQTICGLSKSDTVMVTTVPVGMKEWDGDQFFSVYPNPSNGSFTISPSASILSAAQRSEGFVHATVRDLSGRFIYQQMITLSNNSTMINLQAAPGIYILKLTDSEGNTVRQSIMIE